MRPYIHGYENIGTGSDSGSSQIDQHQMIGKVTKKGMTIDTPAGNKVVERPDRVYIKDFEANDIYFNFTTTGSIGDTVGTNGTWISFGSASDATMTGSSIPRADQERDLQISPTAWKGSANTAGSVLFIYNNGQNK